MVKGMVAFTDTPRNPLGKFFLPPPVTLKSSGLLVLVLDKEHSYLEIQEFIALKLRFSLVILGI